MEVIKDIDLEYLEDNMEVFRIFDKLSMASNQDDAIVEILLKLPVFIEVEGD